jgi:hypothetical protein
MSNNALATLAPTNMKEAMEFAGLLAKSDIVPKDYQGKPGNVLVASSGAWRSACSPCRPCRTSP